MRRRLCLLALSGAALYGQGRIEWVAGTGGSPLGGPNQFRVPAREARIYNGRNISIDSQGRVLFAGGLDRRVWRITPGGEAEVIAGNRNFGGVRVGNALDTPFIDVSGVAEDGNGNIFIGDSSVNDGRPGVYVIRPSGRLELVENYFGNSGALTTDSANTLFHETGSRFNQIVRRSPVTAAAVPVAGDGNSVLREGQNCNGVPATACGVGNATAMWFDSRRQELLWTHDNQAYLREANGTLRRLAGSERFPGFAGNNGPAAQALLSRPGGIVRAPNGLVYIADSGNECIRGISATGIIFSAVGVCRSGLRNETDGARSDEVMIGGLAGLALSATHMYWSTIDGRVSRLALSDLPQAPLAASTPAISQGGVVDAATFQGVLSNWGWATIFGRNLARDTMTWDGAIRNNQLPANLGGTEVTVNGRAAYLSYVSPGQVNILVPPVFTRTSESGTLVIRTAGGSMTLTVTGSSNTAQLFGYADGSVPRPWAFLNGGGVLAGPPGAVAGVEARPARGGDTLTIYFSGGVTTNPAAMPGVLSGTPLVCSAGGPQVLLDDLRVANDYCGMILPGVFQVNFRLPAFSSERDVNLRLDTGSVANGTRQLRVAP